MSETKRPTMVKILAVIVFIGSVLPILAGMMILTGGAFETYFVEESLHQIIATYYVLVGLAGLVPLFSGLTRPCIDWCIRSRIRDTLFQLPCIE